MILILTSDDDTHADRVQAELERRGAELARFDPAWFPREASPALAVDGDGGARDARLSRGRGRARAHRQRPRARSAWCNSAGIACTSSGWARWREPRGRARSRDVGFRHTWRSPWAVRHVDVAIPAGGKLAVVGPSGSGKSTLVTLLAAPRARARSASTASAALDLRSVRRRLGVVLQDPFLLSGTIAGNIALRRPDAPRSGVLAAAELAACTTRSRRSRPARTRCSPTRRRRALRRPAPRIALARASSSSTRRPRTWTRAPRRASSATCARSASPVS